MSSTSITAMPLKYLDQAMNKLRDLGLMPEKTDEAPVISLINKISDLDEEKTIAIARTLNQASLFNEVVREQIQAMRIGERYEGITERFNSIRDDAKEMVDQLEDGKIDVMERIGNVWMKVTRGDIPTRFQKIRETYLEVAADTKDQIEREQIILDAYRDFRGALKESEVLALNVLKKADAELEQAKTNLSNAAKDIETNTSEDREQIARLELARDERLRELQNSDDRYQITKDLSDNLTISYNTSEAVMARLLQTTNAKERVYSQSVTFFGTNETVFTALSASFTGLHGLHEATETLKSMKEGINQSLEILGEVGDKVQEEALREGYGATIKAESVKKLVDSIVNFQERSVSLIEEMRDQATRNAEEVRLAAEDGKRRLAELASRGNALVINA
ncbi:cell surface protein [Kangiella sp. HZ709]|uniref:cell surface protein n=1 Tax=Kangiella sp. HZ709 TaxID=2666328 RepID=UPI0012B0AD5E|nr:cell surface protein [Kangiella sp. HZ709]MRX26548.1 cell surface protein [Kangiella sp. HZ709]